MSDRAALEEFLSQRRLAVAGVSRSGKKFGNLVYRSLKQRGYTVVPINPQAATVEGDRCAASLAAVPEPVDGVVLVVPPAVSERVVREAAAVGIRRVWFQPGSSTPAVLRLAEELGLAVVADECIMMHAGPVRGVHGLHRALRRLFGRLPG